MTDEHNVHNHRPWDSPPPSLARGSERIKKLRHLPVSNFALSELVMTPVRHQWLLTMP